MGRGIKGCYFVSLVFCSLANSAGAWHHSYLLDGDEGFVFAMPVASFHYELARILGTPPDAKDSKADPYEPRRTYPDSSGHHRFVDNREDIWERTLQWDEKQLQAALECTEMNAIPADPRVSRYVAVRRALRQAAVPRGAGSPPPSRPDFTGYESLFESIPNEFAEYAKAAAYFHAGDLQGAADHANAVLALPEDDRRFRSVWAAYLLGNAQMEMNPDEAVSAFEQVRLLVSRGFADPLDLASESVGKQGLVEMTRGRFVEAVRCWSTLFPSNDPAVHEIGYGSLRVLCKTVFRKGLIPPELTSDSLSRQVLTAWVNSQDDAQWTRAWAEAVRNAQVEDVSPGAEFLAWAAFNADDLEAAERWAALAPESPYALWVRAKLLLIDGKRDEGIALFRRTLDALPTGDAAESWTATYPYSDYLSPREEVLAQLGTLLLSRGDYAEALDAFLKSERYDWDADYIAERVLTVEELRKYIESIPQDAPADHVSVSDLEFDRRTYQNDRLRTLLAHRLARQGAWFEAAPLFDEHPPHWTPGYGRQPPDGSPRDWARAMGDHLQKAEDTHLSRRTRAEQYFQAGLILFKADYSLLSAAIAPGFEANENGLLRNRQSTQIHAYYGDRLAEVRERLDQASQFIAPSDDELQRVARHAPQPGKRYFQRYVTADTFLQCADLLPKNDELTARALFLGGFHLRYFDPSAADVFYKRLVRQCGKTPLGKEADRLRWFPPLIPEIQILPGP